ncbi:CbtB domain-containing protein [Halocatena halophila]|uniref:CbtB domain-containing protein n=1 Tax=Halocatena halophila TaxID=2814576 RepID=UPI002ED53844
MSSVPHTVHGRLERTMQSVSPIKLAVIVAVILAIGCTLLFVQEPMVHDSFHDFRHAVGVPCH